MVSEAQEKTFSWERARRGSGKQRNALLTERERERKKPLSAENGIYVILPCRKRIHTGLCCGFFFFFLHFCFVSPWFEISLYINGHKEGVGRREQAGHCHDAEFFGVYHMVPVVFLRLCSF